MQQAILNYSSVVNFPEKIDAMCEQVCMESLKDKYYIELFNTIANYNYFNNTQLFIVNIWEAILLFMR